MKLSTFFDWFREQREWRKLSNNSKKMYDYAMNAASIRYSRWAETGRDKVHYITAKEVDEWYDEIKNVTPSKAALVMKVLCRVWNVGKRHKKVDDNPFEKMGIASQPSRTTIWDKETVKQVSIKALELDLPHISLLVEMCYNLGQRPGDMIALKVKDYNSKTKTVKVKQQKTKTTVTLPVFEPFISRLERYSNTVWSTRWGTFLPQIDYSQYGRDFRIVRDSLKLPKDLQLRDLRRTAITEIMENGATDAEGQAVSGHINRQELNTYAPSTLTMARNAMKKRFQLDS